MVERFVQEHDRLPEHGEERDIFERLYAARLDQIRKSPECLAVLGELDSLGLLEEVSERGVWDVNDDSSSDYGLLAKLGVRAEPQNEITELKHVKSRQEPDEIAKRKSCNDFENFQPLFESVQLDIDTGVRKTLKYQDNAEIKQGDLFIVEGQKAYVAETGDTFISNYGRKDCRLRVIFDNGTESDLLLRSLQKALNRDETSRRITDPDLGPLFSNVEAEEDTQSGYIYVLRSLSDHPFISENRSIIHKIGVTSGTVEKRISNAKRDPTFLLSNVEIVATYKLLNMSPAKLEKLLHRFFSSARLDLQIQDRFLHEVEPQEWFLVPFQIIDEAIQKLLDGSLTEYGYLPEESRIVKQV